MLKRNVHDVLPNDLCFKFIDTKAKCNNEFRKVKTNNIKKKLKELINEKNLRKNLNNVVIPKNVLRMIAIDPKVSLPVKPSNVNIPIYLYGIEDILHEVNKI